MLSVDRSNTLRKNQSIHNMSVQTESCTGDQKDAIANGKIQSEESCRCFSLAEIQSATNEFDDNLVIGKGGFGKVYKGFIDHGDTIVAIKRSNAESKQGAREFWAEIVTLSKLRHHHLVTLIGYCDELAEMILVYEYMPNGTLADHLYRKSRRGNCADVINHQFSWEERLKICIDAARGLDYLHTNTDQSVIHRDIKTTNILLDENWAAKISDFGLSKICTTQHTHSHVSTDIKGTFGYLDPEYFLTRRLTKKSDVYAFGVVLIEVLCARPPVDASIDEDQCSLAVWAQNCIRKGTLDQIIDPSLRGQISPSCLKAFAEVASKCLHNHPKGRPTMAEVVASLELVLASLVPQRKGVITRLFGQILHLIARSFDVGWIKWQNYWSENGLSLKLWRDPFPGSGVKLYRRFTLSEIRSASNNFHKVLGDGGYTKVYRGLIDKGNREVAIKRWKEGASNERNLDQFRFEIQVQSQLRYLHIVSLIGYCNDKHELILVYDYMVHGSLYRHLYETNGDPLPWKKRLEICTGVARGLQYLHAGTKQVIIHHNVKPTSILLDENWVAKLGGFESSTVLPNNESSTALSTFVAGTVGYMDPAYLASANLTIKSDVYSFGVILLELLCGRKPMIYLGDENQVNLVRWFKTNIEGGTVDQIIDLHLIDKIAPECLEVYIKIAENCVRDEGSERPSMDNVLGNLWCALQMQEIWENQNQFANLPQPEPDSVSHNVIIDIACGEAADEMSPTALEDSDYFSGNLAR